MNINEYLNKVANTIDKIGYVKSNSTDDMPTWEVALNIDDNKDNIKVNEALKWVKELKASNDYEKKLQAICLKEDVSYNELPYVASLIPSYNRHIDIESNKRLLRESSNYAGEVGSTVELDIVDTKERTFMSKWGRPSSIYSMVDIEGNNYVWITDYGTLYNPKHITGTIKKYQMYEGIKQTVLTRVKQLG